MEHAIATRALRKTYSPAVVAVEGLELTVNEGEFFGMLGPNGAGKTTTIGILTTRVRATAGEALVAGANVRSDPALVRRRIGVVPQRPNPDRGLSVIENLVFHAAYFGIGRAEATRRATALLDRLGIAEKKNGKVDQLSGGQQQRLMIARALTHEPQVLFLDEPTVGLDPQARLALWDILRDLHRQGRSIIMTTHYMDEADQLCDRIAIMDQGKLLALDTPAKLKAEAPGDTIVEVVFDADTKAVAADAQAIDGVSKAEARGAQLRVFSRRAGEIIPALIAAGESRGLTVRDIHLSRPSLETLFISLTGRKLT
ncbi:MAG TPA: ABC transporter ATP-binding protein [Thermoanaerobaculia bacterium]|nr:ABC transporter ATP-binding protein [Thermoanaerobaculia bacterium]